MKPAAAAAGGGAARQPAALCVTLFDVLDGGTIARRGCSLHRGQFGMPKLRHCKLSEAPSGGLSELVLPLTHQTKAVNGTSIL
jgi:hypothetical protein